MVIVDTHVHPVATDARRYPLASGGPPESAFGMSLAAEELQGHMAAAGVDQAVLVQAFTAYRYDNSYSSDAAAAYPGQFVSVCRVDPLDPDPAGRLSYWVEQRGARGVRLGGHPAGGSEQPWYASAGFWQRAEALGIPVCLQIAASSLETAGPILERFPGVKVVLDHLARAGADELVSLARYSNLYLKFSTLNIREPGEGAAFRGFFEKLLAGFGPARLMWGSDFPHSQGTPAAPYVELVELARAALSFLPSEDQGWVLGGTARALFPALAPI